MTTPSLLTVYIPLVSWTLTGWVLGRLVPQATPAYIGKFLFWVGVPLGIVAFLRHAEVSVALWIAPVAAWLAILLGISLAAWFVHHPSRSHTWKKPTIGSFLLASMVGNTGYIGFPVSLALVGPQYFAWALFYDLVGSGLGAYGLGVAVAARHSGCSASNMPSPWRSLLQNPALASFGVGLAVRDAPIPQAIETSLHGFAWFVVSLSLVLVGMRLSQLSSLRSIKPALICVGIKMVLVPLVLGSILWAMGVTGLMHRALLLQMAMPPAFATLVIAEAYELDHDLAVTALVVGSLGLLVLLPIWLALFGDL